MNNRHFRGFLRLFSFVVVFYDFLYIYIFFPSCECLDRLEMSPKRVTVATVAPLILCFPASPGLATSLTHSPLSPSIVGLVAGVDVKHDVYLPTCPASAPL